MNQIKVASLFTLLVAFPSTSFGQERKPNDPSMDIPNIRKHIIGPVRSEVRLLDIIELRATFQPYPSPIPRSSLKNMLFQVKGLDSPLWPSNPFSTEYAIAKGYYKKHGLPRWDCWP